MMGNAKMRSYVMRELIRRTRGRSMRRFQADRGGEGGTTITGDQNEDITGIGGQRLAQWHHLKTPWTRLEY